MINPEHVGLWTAEVLILYVVVVDSSFIIYLNIYIKLHINSVAIVRERTIPTERPPPVGEVSANFADRGVSRGQRNGSPRPLISVFWTGVATFLFK